MTLRELSSTYQESASILRVRIVELHRAEQQQTDREAVRKLEMRIADLMPLLREMQELSHYTAHYYDRGNCRDGRYTV